MTTWGEGRPEETANDEFNRVQVEIGCDATDIWLSFNRSTSAVQMTYDDAAQLIIEMATSLGLKQQERIVQQIGDLIYNATKG